MPTRTLIFPSQAKAAIPDNSVANEAGGGKMQRALAMATWKRPVAWR